MSIISYAQNAEDILLLRALAGVKKGFYVDVGAWSPVDDSVTKLFYDRGWSGINIEPVAYWHQKLVDERPRDLNLRLAAGSSSGRLTLHVVGQTGLSTADDMLARRYQAEGMEVAEESVPVCTLDSILDEHASGPIHFLKIDVEGAEKDVLRGLNLSRHRPWIVVIEANVQGERREDWAEMLSRGDYSLVHKDGLNHFYLAQEHDSLRKAFTYPPNVLDDFIPYRFSSRLEWYAAHVEKVESKAAGYRAEADEACLELDRARGETRRLLDRLAEPDLMQNEVVFGPRRLFVDVTMLAAFDAGTGIQRVVRNILSELLRNPPEGYLVQPVRFERKQGYVHARTFHAKLDPNVSNVEDDVIVPLPGDKLLGLDLIADILPDHRDYFEWLRGRGVALWFVVYDLLPVLRPDFFPEGSLGIFRRWYTAIAELATGVACISQAVADELKRWVDQIQPQRPKALQIGHFHLGSAMDRTEATLISNTQRDPLRFLMVGTIEVRKGHSQVLDAFELLWHRGIEAHLEVIGRAGWLSNGVMERLQELTIQGNRITWKSRATDDELLDAYASAGALIMASEGEGYGLPIVEAAMHGLPIIARDLPVFREVGGDGVWYFRAESAADLADAIECWLQLAVRGEQPLPERVCWISWSQSASQLMKVLEYGAQGLWHAGSEYVFDSSHPEALTVVGERQRGVIVSSGVAGYLVYGPYSPLEAGDYDVTAAFGAAGAVSGGCFMDIVGDDESPLHHEWLDARDPVDGCIAVRFRLHLSMPVKRFQFRVFVAQGAHLVFHGATFSPLGQSDAYTRAVRAEGALLEARQLGSELGRIREKLEEAENALSIAGKQAAEAVAALREAHAREDALSAALSQAQLAHEHLRRHLVLIESSRSWRITAPLRTCRAFAYESARGLVHMLRPTWHRVVRSRHVASMALALSSPLPRVRARLNRSIEAHRRNAALAAESFPTPSSRGLSPGSLFACGPETSYVYFVLLELRRRREESGACDS